LKLTHTSPRKVFEERATPPSAPDVGALTGTPPGRRLVDLDSLAGDGEEHVVERRRADVEPGHGQPLVAERDEQVRPVLAGGLGGDADARLGHLDGGVVERLEAAGDGCGPISGVGAALDVDVEYLAADPSLEVGRRPLGDDGAVEDDRQPVAELVGLLEVLGREEDGGAAVVYRPEVLPQPVAGLRVQARRRLVEEDQWRLVNQRRRGVEPLLHAAGELLGALVGLVGEVDEVQQVGDAPVALAPRDAVGLAGEPDVLLRCQLRVDAGLLGHVADGLPDLPGLGRHVEAVDPDAPAGRRQQRGEHLDRGRLARAVRPEEAEELPLGYRQVDAANGLGAVGVGQPEVLDAHGGPTLGGGRLRRSVSVPMRLAGVRPFRWCHATREGRRRQKRATSRFEKYFES
jgi:hypothetical protein